MDELKKLRATVKEQRDGYTRDINAGDDQDGTWARREELDWVIQEINKLLLIGGRP